MGTAVALKNDLHGTIKYIGKMRRRKGTWYGIKLTSKQGDTDGMDNGRYYFVCKDKYGVFVKKKDILTAISNTRAAIQLQKRARLRSSNISLFDFAVTQSTTNLALDSDDYESSVLHRFLRFNLSTLIEFLDNATLHNLFAVEHFTSFYDTASFWNSTLLTQRITAKSSEEYKYLQRVGIHVNVWNVEAAYEQLKSHETVRERKWKVRRNRFMVFVALQHIKQHKGLYRYNPKSDSRYGPEYTGFTYGHYGRRTRTRAPKREVKKNVRVKRVDMWALGQKLVYMFGDESAVSHDLVSVGQKLVVCANVRLFKQFRPLITENRGRPAWMALLRNRKNRAKIIRDIERVLMIPIAETLVKQWLIFSTPRQTVICGWISSQCVLAVYGGCIDQSSLR